MNNIYKLIDPINNKVRYIGRTKRQEKRYSSHIRGEGINENKELWIDSLRLLNKFPIMEIIEENVSDDDIKEREKYWIDHYKSNDLLNIQNNTFFYGKSFQLTTVKINPEIYKEFKIKSLDTKITLQELINISIFLYIRDDKYIKLIHDTISRSAIL